MEEEARREGGGKKQREGWRKRNNKGREKKETEGNLVLSVLANTTS